MLKRVLALVLCVPVALPGCGSILFPQQQEVPTDCTNVATASFAVPAAGTSVRSGQPLRLDRRKDHTVEVRAEGYDTQTVRVQSQVSVARAAVSILLNGGHGLFTLFITTFIGVFADIRSGAWQVLEPTELQVQLYRPGEGPPPHATAAWPTTTPSPSAFCPSCGARAGDTTFCTGCGARQR